MVESYAGKVLTKQVEKEIKQKSKAKRSRIIKPNSLCTNDYRLDRVNIHVDDKGTIVNIVIG